jgi:hypothetical protein
MNHTFDRRTFLRGAIVGGAVAILALRVTPRAL